ncbi:hypothetical protein ZWY2020_025139 [Hordeum vulgare]|nr:hypothetical protein ZWY2020_025139 [Hordeum vulgare]
MVLTFLSSPPSSSPSPPHLGQISSPIDQPEDPQINPPPPDGHLHIYIHLQLQAQLTGAASSAAQLI